MTWPTAPAQRWPDVLGWDIVVERPVTELTGPEDPRVVNYRRWGVPYEPLPSVRLAWWSARLSGTAWLKTLCDSGDAKLISGNGGYPVVYVARAHGVIRIIDEPPACDRWAKPANVEAVKSTPPDTWLVVLATDQS